MGRFREIGEGRFRKIAEQITRDASERGGITHQELLEIIGSSGQGSGGSEINCYPGFPGDQCHSFAVFVSLKGKLSRGRWKYSFSGILDALIQHFQGKCPGKIREGVVITDTWESWTYEKWRSNIDAIKNDGVYLEIYLIGEGLITEIPI